MNKFGNIKCTYKNADGTTMKFDSKKEMKRYIELSLFQKSGQISDLQCQVEFELIPKHKREDGTTERACKYIADFVYTCKGKKVVEDVKGYRDSSSAAYAKFTIKRKLMLDRFGITIREI